MENENVIIETGSVIDFINALSYGSTIVKYADQQAKDYTKDAIIVFNEMNGGEFIEERPLLLSEIIDEVFEDATESDLGQWFRILFKMRVRLDALPITEDDIEVIGKAEAARENKSRIIVKMNPALVKYAEKLARRHGIKFFPESNYWVFTGEPKKESAFKLMQRANLEGQDKIEFDLKEYSSQTIRCYASNLSAEIGRKLTVNVSEGKMVVRFKEQPPEEVLYSEVATLYRSACVKLGHDKAREVFESVVFDAEFDNVPETAPQDRKPGGMIPEENLVNYEPEEDSDAQFQDDDDF